MYAYVIDLESLTVIRAENNGENFDMNADGEPCESINDLRAFVSELREQGAYGADVEAELLAELA